MAWDNDADRVVTNRTAHGLRRKRGFAVFCRQLLADVAIATQLSQGDLQQFLPYALPKRRSLRLEKQCRYLRVPAGKVLVQPSDDRLKSFKRIVTRHILIALGKVLLAIKPKTDQSLSIATQRQTTKLWANILCVINHRHSSS